MEEWKEKSDKEIQKIADQIRNASEGIPIPEELHPEAVRKRLEKQVKKGQTRRAFRIYGGAAAAAMAVLVVWSGVRHSYVGKGYSAAQDAVFEEIVEEAEAAAETCAPPEEGNEEEPIRTAESYQEIYDRLTEYAYEESKFLEREMTAGVSGADGGTGDIRDLASNAAPKDYSESNVREAGVDEADITKTDGTYLYTAAADTGSIQIIRAADLKVCAKIKAQGTDRIEELYVENDRLTVLASGAATELSLDRDGLYDSGYRTETSVTVYDISDPEVPKELGRITQEGDYRTSRVSDNYLYLFTDCWKQKKEAEDVGSYIPRMNGELLASDCIYLPGTQAGGHYLLISSVNLANPSKIADSRGILCSSSETYISGQNIYLMQTRYESGSGTERTEVFKFRFFSGMIRAKAVGLVSGSVKDSFCADEYDGNLRIVTTCQNGWEPVCALYVLNEDLELIGSLENVAFGETVRSARLMGDVGYFVTFRNTDPLFCVDLSDPTAPVVLGELKVSGFSGYLHPFGEGKLLGMGQEADESSGRITGGKLSMFDISSPEEMKELDRVVFKNTDLANLFDYRSVLADPDKNIIGVCLERWDNGTQSVNYQIFCYDEEKGFVRQLDYSMLSGKNDLYKEKVRSLYIADTLYLVSPMEISAFSMKDGYEKAGTLVFDGETFVSASGQR